MRLKDILKILCSSLLLLSFTGCSSDDDPDMPPPAGDVTTDGMVIYEANPALFGEAQALNGLTAQLPRIKSWKPMFFGSCPFSSKVKRMLSVLRIV